MKQVKVIEEVEDGLQACLGENVLLMCVNYFYTGTLVGVNDTCVKLLAPKVVYSTGEWSDDSWADSQPLTVGFWYVQTGAIESWGLVGEK